MPRVYELTVKTYNIDIVHASHDIMAMTVTYAFGGDIIFSHDAYVLYRQHTSNVSHVPITLLQRIKAELKKMRNLKGRISDFAGEILKSGGSELSLSVRKTLALISGYKKNILYRLIILFSPKFRTGDFRLTLIGKFKVLIGWL